MERAASPSRSPYRQLPVPVVVAQQGRVVDWSDAFATLSGRAAGELFELPLSALFDAPLAVGDVPALLLGPSARLAVRARTSTLDDGRTVSVVEPLGRDDRVYRTTFEHAPIGMVQGTFDGRLLMVNEHLCTTLGYSRDELLQRSFHDVTHPDDREHTRVVLSRLATGGLQRLSFEKRYLHRSGRVVQAEVTVTLERDERGAPSHLLALVHDVTRRHDAETALWRTVSQLMDAERLARVGSWELDVDANEIVWSEQLFRIFELPAGPFGPTYETFLERQHPDDRENVDRVFQASVLARTQFSLVHRLLMPDGRVKWVQSQGETFQPVQGRVRAVGTVQDVTERFTTELGLRDRERRLSTILAALEDLVVLFQLVDGELSVIELNPAGLERIQRLAPSLTVERVLGARISTLAAALEPALPEVQELLAALRRVFETGEGLTRELEVRLPSGLVVHSEVKFLPVPHGLSLPPLVLLVARDFTERKQAEVLLRRSLTEKETLLAEVHHRVKNNLQLISSMLSLQGADGVDARTSELLAEAKARLQTMALMHQHLYRSNEFAHVSLDQHVRALATMAAQSSGAWRHGVTLRCELEPAEVSLDHAIPLGLVLNELLSNAFKHAFVGRAGGEVVVGCRCDGEAVVLEVRDDGRGLPPDFELVTPRTLGLRLVRALVAQLRAELRVDGTAGTRFTLTLPTPKKEPCA